MFWRSNCLCMTSLRGADVRENGCFCFLAVELSLWPLSEVQTSEKMGCFDASANSIGVFWIRCSFKLFIYLFYFFLYFLARPSSTSQYKTHSSLHFMQTALILSCCDKFPMTIFWKLHWSQQFSKTSSTNKDCCWSSTCSHAKNKYSILCEPCQQGPLMSSRKMLLWEYNFIRDFCS